MTVVELEIPDGEGSKFVSLQPWEIDYITTHNTTQLPGEGRLQVTTNDGVNYYPTKVDFREPMENS